VVFCIPYFMKRKMDPVTDEFVRQFHAFVADGCAVKLIKWIGLQALWVIGIMFSGMLGTSWGDSTYMTLLLSCFDQYIYSIILKYDPMLASYFKYDARTFAKSVYGDDMMLSYPIRYWKYIIGDVPITDTIDLSVLSNYMKSAGGVTIKPSEAFVYVEKKRKDLGPFFSLVTRDGYLSKPGPKFLQRRFVPINHNNDLIAAPWRVKTDYYMKSAFTFQDETAEYYWIIKWRSLQYDTCGTNPAAYDYLQFLIDGMIKMYALTPKQLDDGIKWWIEKEMGGDAREHDSARKRLLKLGIRSQFYGKAMPRNEILHMFLWDNDYQKMRAALSNNRFYEKDGSYENIDKPVDYSMVNLDLLYGN